MPRVDRATLASRLRRAWRVVVRSARLAVGVPDYDTYVCHCRRAHPDREPMSRDAFFRERMDARYGRGRSRCC
ncbi:YbdD/YjiX family protein [Lysobacter bugurensis]